MLFTEFNMEDALAARYAEGEAKGEARGEAKMLNRLKALLKKGLSGKEALDILQK